MRFLARMRNWEFRQLCPGAGLLKRCFGASVRFYLGQQVFYCFERDLEEVYMGFLEAIKKLLQVCIWAGLCGAHNCERLDFLNLGVC